MREKEIHPAIGIVVVVLILAGLGYAFWIRPAMRAAQIKQEWTSPQAAAARSPEGRRPSTGFMRAVMEARQREGRR
jgi:hypothetical protein